jgi:hypothetical protein
MHLYTKMNVKHLGDKRYSYGENTLSHGDLHIVWFDTRIVRLLSNNRNELMRNPELG